MAERERCIKCGKFIQLQNCGWDKKEYIGIGYLCPDCYEEKYGPPPYCGCCEECCNYQCQRMDLNHRPVLYEGTALTAELRWHVLSILTKDCS